jgi:SAM-dependent methyltransferase
MVDGGDEDGWSRVAAGWAELWGAFGEPVQRAIIEAAAIGPGTRVVDVGCGSGEFLQLLTTIGARAVGADPAPRMVEVALTRGAEVLEAGAEALPFADATFDVATAVNALQFAEDTTEALHEMARVVGPDGHVVIANWAEGPLNDIDVVERAVTAALDEEPHPDGPLRPAGGIEAALADAGLEVVASGVVAMPWVAGDEATLVRGILLGEDASTMAELHDTIVAAATPFRDDAGGYTLQNTFRWGMARVTAATGSAPRLTA